MTGCGHADCARENAAYQRDRARQLARPDGTWRPFSDETASEQAAEVAARASRAGIGSRRIAEVTGLSRGTVAQVRARRRTRSGSCDAVLGAALTPAAGTTVDATLARLAFEALRAAGWGVDEIAAVTGLSRSTLRFRSATCTLRTSQVLVDFARLLGAEIADGKVIEPPMPPAALAAVADRLTA
jgi:hypothetical protein